MIALHQIIEHILLLKEQEMRRRLQVCFFDIQKREQTSLPTSEAWRIFKNGEWEGMAVRKVTDNLEEVISYLYGLEPWFEDEVQIYIEMFSI